MHEHHVRNLPVVDEEGSFIGLFGLRRLSHLLLPRAALNLGKHSVSSLHFLPDEVVQMGDRWHKIADQPVENFLEKPSKLLFCKPGTAFPELLALLDESKDTSLPVIVIKGKSKKLVGMVSTTAIRTSQRSKISNLKNSFTKTMIILGVRNKNAR
jgi:CBS domain-containing protein